VDGTERATPMNLMRLEAAFLVRRKVSVATNPASARS
jgi:hypothetical protein